MVTKGVPCEKRIADLKKFELENEGNLERDVEDGWVETANPQTKQNNNDPLVDIDNIDGQNMQVVSGEEQKQEEEAFDLDDLDDDNMFAKPVQ